MDSNIEIERKFLVNSELIKVDQIKKMGVKTISIIQGYLSLEKERIVRIRVEDNLKATITIKGVSSSDGLFRFEWQKEIDLDDAENLLRLCKGQLIEKERVEIELGKNYILEVDIFHGYHQGLVIAELELLKVDDLDFKKYLPKWLGREVTGDSQYYNSSLALVKTRIKEGPLF